ncbi:MAG: Gfo/Idh/MocA family oxidoreductase [Hyphomicrobiales bacterium]|nr:Gfo/Idh/MocA family oxidoreductase [Hyphomicrobiales bacterium]
MTRLLIIGTGSMARQHALAFRVLEDVEIVAAVEPNEERLQAFSEEHGISNKFADLDAAIAWNGFDAASNVTPDIFHHPLSMKLIDAGKHVLCEKPLATNYPLALEMTEAAENRGVINMVNLTFRSSPALKQAREIVLSGEIGDIRHFEASYLQSWLVGHHWGDWRTDERWLWRLSTKHGSHGVIGDIGIHVIDFATHAAARDIVWMESRAKTFHKAEGDRIDGYPLDANDSFAMTVELTNGALGVIHATRFGTGYANAMRLELFGSHGAIRLTSDGRHSTLEICVGADIDTQTWRDVPCPPVPSVFEIFAEAIRTGENSVATFRRAAEIQRILDLTLQAGSRSHGGVRLD